MNITLLFFGRLQDITGETRLSWQATSLTQLRQELEARWPAMAQQQVLWSLNQQVVKGDAELKEGDEIALMPPFAGG